MARRGGAGQSAGRRRTTASFSIEGLKELDAALGELGKATARNAMQRALRRIAEYIRAPMEALAPRLSGDLATSIIISVRSVARAGKKAFADVMKAGGSRQSAGMAARSANKGAKGKDTFSQVFVGPDGSEASIGIFNEFGTSKMQAQPFARPAFDEGAPMALDALKPILREEIQKASARAARKALKKARAGL